MDVHIPIPIANANTEVENKWISKLITYWLTYLLFSLTTFTGKKYMNVHSKDLVEFLPLVLTISILAFLIAKFKPNSCLQTVLIGTGIFCTNVFVISGVIPTDHPVTLRDSAFIFVGAALPIFQFLRVATTVPVLFRINASVECLVSRGWRVIGTVLITMIACAKLDNEDVVSSLNAYATVAYMFLQLSTFFPSDPVATLWFVSIGWLSLVPIVLTALLRTNYPNLTNAQVCFISVSLVYH